MGAQRYTKGDRVALVKAIAPGIAKRREGAVIECGARGVRIRFDDGAELWQRAHDVELVASASERRSARLQVVEAAEVLPALAEPPPTTPSASDVLARLEASGADLVGLWRALGAGLTERKRRAVTEAEEAVKAAEVDVREAEQLLADSRRTLAAAKAQADDARRELAVVEREMGVVR